MIITTYSEHAAEDGVWFSSIDASIKYLMKQGEKFPTVSDKHTTWKCILEF